MVFLKYSPTKTFILIAALIILLKPSSEAQSQSANLTFENNHPLSSIVEKNSGDIYQAVIQGEFTAYEKKEGKYIPIIPDNIKDYFYEALDVYPLNQSVHYVEGQKVIYQNRIYTCWSFECTADMIDDPFIWEELSNTFSPYEYINGMHEVSYTEVGNSYNPEWINFFLASEYTAPLFSLKFSDFSEMLQESKVAVVLPPELVNMEEEPADSNRYLNYLFDVYSTSIAPSLNYMPVGSYYTGGNIDEMQNILKFSESLDFGSLWKVNAQLGKLQSNEIKFRVENTNHMVIPSYLAWNQDQFIAQTGGELPGSPKEVKHEYEGYNLQLSELFVSIPFLNRVEINKKFMQIIIDGIRSGLISAKSHWNKEELNIEEFNKVMIENPEREILAYDNGMEYYQEDLVSYNGSLYSPLGDGIFGTPPDDEFWWMEVSVDETYPYFNHAEIKPLILQRSVFTDFSNDMKYMRLENITFGIPEGDEPSGVMRPLFSVDFKDLLNLLSANPEQFYERNKHLRSFEQDLIQENFYTTQDEFQITVIDELREPKPIIPRSLSTERFSITEWQRADQSKHIIEKHEILLVKIKQALEKGDLNIYSVDFDGSKPPEVYIGEESVINEFMSLMEDSPFFLEDYEVLQESEVDQELNYYSTNREWLRIYIFEQETFEPIPFDFSYTQLLDLGMGSALNRLEKNLKADPDGRKFIRLKE